MSFLKVAFFVVFGHARFLLFALISGGSFLIHPTPISAANHIVAKGELLALPYSQATCGLRDDLKPKEYYVGVKFSIVNLSNNFEIKKSDTIKTIFKSLRKLLIGNQSGLFVVFAKIINSDGETAAVFPVYQWDSETNKDTITDSNNFFVMNYVPANHISNLKLVFDVRYTEETKSNIFKNVKRVLELAATAYSGGLGSAAIALGAAKLKDASEYDRQLELFLNRVKNFEYRPVIVRPNSFIEDNCYDKKTPIKGFHPYDKGGTDRPKQGVSLVFSGLVQKTKQPVTASLKLVYRTSYLLDNTGKFATYPFVGGKNREDMLKNFRANLSPDLQLSSKLENEIWVVEPQSDPKRSVRLSVERLALKGRLIELRGEFNRFATSKDRARLGPICAEFMRIVSDSPFTIWDKALITAGFLERNNLLKDDVLKTCIQHNLELKTLTDRIRALVLIKKTEKKPTAITNIATVLSDRKKSTIKPYSSGDLANTYSVSDKFITTVVKINTSFPYYDIPGSFEIAALKPKLLNDNWKNFIGVLHGEWKKKLQKSNHSLFKAFEKDDNYWTLENSIDRLVKLEGVHNSFLVMLLLQHIATAKGMTFACLQDGQTPPKHDEIWILEGLARVGSKKVETIDIRKETASGLSVGTCFFELTT